MPARAGAWNSTGIRRVERVLMAVRSILLMGDPRLLQPSERVAEFDTGELHALIADLQDTMQAFSGAGLSAPQIGVRQRVVIFGGDAPNPRYPGAELVPFTVLVNPELTILGAEMQDDWEGCLSVPGMRGLVPRYQSLRYAGHDQFGVRIDRQVSGFHARVVQHEVDHLDGVLYPQRIRDMRQFGFIAELFPGQRPADQ
jgi:peptide deformylase